MPSGNEKENMMAVRRDLSDLPTGSSVQEGCPPDEKARFMPALAEAWKAERNKQERPHAVEGTRFRGSDAGQCARALSYTFRGMKPTNPPTLSDEWRMGVGTMVHDNLEPALQAAFPNAEVEMAIDYRPTLDGSGHGDVMIAQVLMEEPGGDETLHRIWRTHIEVKSINGFGFKRAVGATKGAPDGPRTSAIIQGSLNSFFDEADELVIGYLSLENMGKYLQRLDDPEGIRLFSAEWTFSKEEFTRIAEAEIARINEVLRLVDADQPVRRFIVDSGVPAKAQVTSPDKGLWVVKDDDGTIVDTGKTWQCDYCKHHDRCVQDLSDTMYVG